MDELLEVRTPYNPIVHEDSSYFWERETKSHVKDNNMEKKGGGAYMYLGNLKK